MKKAASAIIIRNNALLVMHRNKFGHEYYTLVGGGVNHGEEIVQALYREIQEETGLLVANPRLMFEEDAGPPYGTQYIFACDYMSGEIALQPNSEEAEINKLGQNVYTPMWLPLEELREAEFLSAELQRRIVQALETGWPAKPVCIGRS